MSQRSTLGFVTVFLAVTMGLGLALRWEFMTGWLSAQGVSFGAMRHAHSHGGYYGVLVLPWFWALSRAGSPLPTTLVHTYAAIALAATLCFVPFDYNALTITLSTLVLAGWIAAAVVYLKGGTSTGRVRGADAESWLAPTPWAMLIGAAFIPAVAVLASRNPALSGALAHLFLGILLLGVFVPTAFALSGLRRKRSSLAFLCAACLSAGVFAFPELFGAAGAVLLAFYAWRVGDAVRETATGLRILWMIFAAGLVLQGLLPLFQTYAVRIAGIHFAILGPVLVSFAMAAKIRAGRVWAALYGGSLGAMLAAIAWGTHVLEADAFLWTAVTSSAYVTVTAIILIRHALAGKDAADESGAPFDHLENWD